MKIYLRDDVGLERNLSGDADSVEQWPMWNADSSMLMWVSWKPKAESWSIVTLDMKAPKALKRFIPLVKKGLEFKLGEMTLLFGRVGWPDWQHPLRDRLIFPATFVSW